MQLNSGRPQVWHLAISYQAKEKAHNPRKNLFVISRQYKHDKHVPRYKASNGSVVEFIGLCFFYTSIFFSLLLWQRLFCHDRSIMYCGSFFVTLRYPVKRFGQSIKQKPRSSWVAVFKAPDLTWPQKCQLCASDPSSDWQLIFQTGHCCSKVSCS